MFLAEADAPFAADLERAFPRIREEAAAVAPHEFLPWPDEHAHSGGWSVFPLLTADPLWHLAHACAANAARLPHTMQVVRCIPGVVLAGLSCLEPGTHIYRHVDLTAAATARCHLGLEVNPRAFLRVLGETRTWESGRCLVFDSGTEHEAGNLGPERRVVLLVDVARGASGGRA